MIASTSEKDDFETQYYGMSRQLIVAFNDIVVEKISVLGSLRVSIMAHALDWNRQQQQLLNTTNVISWPFVTISSFQQRAATVRKLSSSLYIGFYPVVEGYQRTEWESYSAKEKNVWM